MPRRNKNQKHTPFRLVNNEAGKKRFFTKREAEAAEKRRTEKLQQLMTKFGR